MILLILMYTAFAVFCQYLHKLFKRPYQQRWDYLVTQYVAEKIKNSGKYFMYHNHAHEFRKYNGKIYLNAATANESDLFHEIAHIFLGILKVKTK